MRPIARFAALASCCLAASLPAFAEDAAPAKAKPKYGPTGHPYATPLSQATDYFRSAKHAAPDYWALSGYYVPQFNDAACSAASLTMVLNAARAPLPKTSEDKLIIQQDLIEKVNVEDWKQRLSAEGFGPKKEHGVSLDKLGKIAEASFKAYGFPKVKVDVVHVADQSKETKAKLVKALAENEKSTKDFIVANFNQQNFTDDADAGHIAPVGAYDAVKHRVLVMDPDRQWYEPYWVSEDIFLKGLNTKDNAGDTYRGYIVIHLN